MVVSLIAAMSSNRVIGQDNKMPWHLSADLKRFKQITTGHPVIMGRKTLDSLGKPLPNRRNLIVSRTPKAHSTPGCEFFGSLEDALKACHSNDEVFIIGGEQIYRLALPFANRVYLTVIDKTYAGDAFFPELPDTFKEVSNEAGAENGLQFCWKLFEKISH